MSAPPDYTQRLEAQNINQSVIVQAPAGSGKTTLLVTRFLLLLTRVDDPEKVVAITHTNKAANEMRQRIYDALQNPNSFREKQDLFQAANAAREQCKKHNWRLSSNQLNIRTIDSYCQLLAKNSGYHQLHYTNAALTESPLWWYKQAASEEISQLWSTQDKHTLTALQHYGFDFEELESVLVTLLQQREQWLELLGGIRDKNWESHFVQLCKESWEQTSQQLLDKLQQSFGNRVEIWFALCKKMLELSHQYEAPSKKEGLLQHIVNHCSDTPQTDWWRALQNILISGKKTIFKRPADVGLIPQKSIKTKEGVAAQKALTSEIQDALQDITLNLGHDFLPLFIQPIPEPEFPQGHHKLTSAIAHLAIRSAARLLTLFNKYQVLDFTQVALNAIQALKEKHESKPGVQIIDHLLVDEFQDCSRLQWQLLELLTCDWNKDQTLFVVGDPMQAIYAFRGADISLFMRAQEQGIGNIKLANIKLSCNYRSQPALVDWMNEKGSELIEKSDYQIEFAPAISVSKLPSGDLPQLFSFPQGEKEQQLIHLLKRLPETFPQCKKVAILVQKKSQADRLVAEMESNNIAFTAIEFTRVLDEQYAIDICNVARLLVDPNDWRSWLALLRRPDIAICLQSCTNIFTSGLEPLEALHNCNFAGNEKERINWLLQNINPIIESRGLRPFDVLLQEACYCLGLFGSLNSKEKNNADRLIQTLRQSLTTHPGGWWVHWKKLNTILHTTFTDIESAPTSATNNMPSIEIMTCHKAKGLEFDLVILPYADLTIRSSNERPPLLYDFPDNKNNYQLLLATSKNKSEDNNHPNYQYLKHLGDAKLLAERKRLLYVSLTRAEQKLWLCQEESIKGTNSFLSWLGMGSDKTNEQNSKHTSLQKITRQAKQHKGYPLLAKIPDFTQVQQTTSEAPPLSNRAANKPKAINDYSALLGTHLHAVLNWLGKEENWHNKIAENMPKWRQQLAWSGIAKAQLNMAITEMENALTAIAEDTTIRWLLSQQHGFRQSEWRLLQLQNNHVQLRIPDLCFIDKDQCWVVDFKAMHQQKNESESQLIQRAKTMYGSRLDEYASLIQEVASPKLENLTIHCGLFLLLQQQWSYWQYNCTPS